jgi:hypothetical protein
MTALGPRTVPIETRDHRTYKVYVSCVILERECSNKERLCAIVKALLPCKSKFKLHFKFPNSQSSGLIWMWFPVLNTVVFSWRCFTACCRPASLSWCFSSPCPGTPAPAQPSPLPMALLFPLPAPPSPTLLPEGVSPFFRVPSPSQHLPHYTAYLFICTIFMCVLNLYNLWERYYVFCVLFIFMPTCQSSWHVENYVEATFKGKESLILSHPILSLQLRKLKPDVTNLASSKPSQGSPPNTKSNPAPSHHTRVQDLHAYTRSNLWMVVIILKVAAMEIF